VDAKASIGGRRFIGGGGEKDSSDRSRQDPAGLDSGDSRGPIAKPDVA